MGELQFQANKLGWDQDANPKLRNSCLGKKNKSLYCQCAELQTMGVVVSYILLTKLWSAQLSIVSPIFWQLWQQRKTW